MKFIDLTGRQYFNLTVVSRNKSFVGKTMWDCLCDCGNMTIVDSRNLRTGKVKSCGCLRKKTMAAISTTHGMGNKKDRLYSIWLGMRARCFNKRHRAYHRYGGRGITICLSWLEFPIFHDWALSHGYKTNLSIDRINNDGNYESSNCRWATSKEQNNNKSNSRKRIEV